ncbi:MAG: NAD(P)-dependent glycerol-3-phosphate dehydrogenase [Fimbriimonas ginsengisoli]|uniref:Glycerol-3-phosphate dehydrogenase [NAD(P)+] n=1 Tax=Fimbriimonas ginsengisoli TaxID=1005039 RepID=A0A931LSF1_FIMGI|nr:NAD(P)-dependent glycerol-3-phosphate dehydrogenase [Fimbriimonas ginsengisoli]
MEVTVLGAGSWGTALSILLARNGHSVTLAGRNHEEIDTLRAARENLRFMPGFVIPEGVEFAYLDAPLPPTEMTVIAVPSTAVREVCARAKGHPLIVVASKGLEAGSAKTLSQVASEVLPDADVGAISGPNLAVEIVRGIPTAAVTAFADLDTADRVRAAFMCRTFRVYVSQDVLGVELAGALKNVLAIGAGLSDGLGFGDNTKGALLARGLHEMTLLGLAMGARQETFMGLAGVGDLFATAVSKLSRNYRVGRALGEGLSLPEILKQIDQVAEGVSTSDSALILARREGVAMPVFEAIESVIRSRVQPLHAVSLLMERLPRLEGLHPAEA